MNNFTSLTEIFLTFKKKLTKDAHSVCVNLGVHMGLCALYACVQHELHTTLNVKQMIRLETSKDFYRSHRKI